MRVPSARAGKHFRELLWEKVVRLHHSCFTEDARNWKPIPLFLGKMVGSVWLPADTWYGDYFSGGLHGSVVFPLTGNPLFHADRADVLKWRQVCKDRGETLVGQGALDETFDLAFLTEQCTAAGQHQAGVFLDCSKCYELVPLSMLEQFAIDSGYPLYALNVPLDAVDMLHACLIMSLRCAGRQVEVRKYVDDMVLISSGPGFAGNLCFAYRQVLRSLTAVNMKVNALQTVVLCNGFVTKRKLWKVWRGYRRAGRLPPVKITTRDLGVDTQWFAWRNPVQQKRISSFCASLYRTRALGPAHVKARIVKSLFSVGLYGAEIGGISDQHMKDLRASAGGGLGKGACSWRAFWRPSCRC
eukprot:6491664-Amphidinium_carterae.2